MVRFHWKLVILYLCCLFVVVYVFSRIFILLGMHPGSSTREHLLTQKAFTVYLKVYATAMVYKKKVQGYIEDIVMLKVLV